MKEERTPITGPPSPSRVVVALSGGIDSSFAASLLKQAGWDVCGIHLLIPSIPSLVDIRSKSAGQAAEFLKIPYETIDVRGSFERLIIGPFVNAYREGSTPNPCVRCNWLIKFHSLLQYADSQDIPYVATGHYARKWQDENDSEIQLLRGADRSKDQSYFLHRLDPSILVRALFPLGELRKAHVRKSAAKMSLPAHAVPESQEICFIPENDYRLLVEAHIKSGESVDGNIVTMDGAVIGRHKGVFRYTIGQRQGLGIASSRPFYVKEIRPPANEIVVARREALYSRIVTAEDFKWFTKSPPEVARFQAQIRYRHRAAPGTLNVEAPGRVTFTFDKPQWAVTPGQALVCYDGDRLIGGGWITL